jgi:hypothetical protein
MAPQYVVHYPTEQECRVAEKAYAESKDRSIYGKCVPEVIFKKEK